MQGEPFFFSGIQIIFFSPFSSVKNSGIRNRELAPHKRYPYRSHTSRDFWNGSGMGMGGPTIAGFVEFLKGLFHVRRMVTTIPWNDPSITIVTFATIESWGDRSKVYSEMEIWKFVPKTWFWDDFMVMIRIEMDVLFFCERRFLFAWRGYSLFVSAARLKWYNHNTIWIGIKLKGPILKK